MRTLTVFVICMVIFPFKSFAALYTISDLHQGLLNITYASWSGAYDINDNGWIVGSMMDERPWYYDGNNYFINIPKESPFDVSNASNLAINNNNQILMQIDNQPPLGYVNVVYSNGNYQLLDTYYGSSIGLDLDESGNVITKNPFSDPDNLMDLIDSDGYWASLRPTAINVHGQIVGIGRVSGESFYSHAFLMTPTTLSAAVPEPSTIILLSVQALLLFTYSYRRRRCK